MCIQSLDLAVEHFGGMGILERWTQEQCQKLICRKGGDMMEVLTTMGKVETGWIELRIVLGWSMLISTVVSMLNSLLHKGFASTGWQCL